MKGTFVCVMGSPSPHYLDARAAPCGCLKLLDIPTSDFTHTIILEEASAGCFCGGQRSQVRSAEDSFLGAAEHQGA